MATAAFERPGDGDDVAGFRRSTGTRARPRNASAWCGAGASDHFALGVERLDLAIDGIAPDLRCGRSARPEKLSASNVVTSILKGKRVAGKRDGFGLGQLSPRRQAGTGDADSVLVLKFLHRPTVAAGCVEIVGSSAVVIRPRVRNRSKNRFQRLLGLGVGAVDLVDPTMGLRLGQRLESTNLVCGMTTRRHRPRARRAVDHRQDAFHLAAEIGMAGRIDDIDVCACRATSRPRCTQEW